MNKRALSLFYLFYHRGSTKKLLMPLWPLRGVSHSDTIADAILALQVMSGMNPAVICPDYASSGADVNGDRKIGMEEVLYILQKVARLR